jgi:hypothetical protein
MAALALLLLRRRRNETVRLGLLMRAPPLLIASGIREALRGGIAEARKIARFSGVDRLGSEFLSLGREVGLSRSEARQILRDAHRAGSAAESYRRQWLAKIDAGATPREASAATDHAIARTAITEASEAYNSGRTLYLEEATGLDLFKVWDSAFDKNTCPICASADGTVVRINESFPLGEPGSVHPRRMCSWHLVESRRELRAA